jgi:acetyl-CoA carboxylase biotin carboxyl carrier protein
VAEDIRAELVANVGRVVVGQGDAVAAGDTLAFLESMKMEIPVMATTSGTVSELCVVEGQVVHAGDLIARIS